MFKPAIVAVGYNRPESMKRLLNSIGNAKFQIGDITLIISIDRSNVSDRVEQVAKDFIWKNGRKEIVHYESRLGLRNHIVKCGDYTEKYGSVIILEDDLIVAEDFYSYVCESHKKYSGDNRICGVSLYSYRSNPFTRFTFIPAPSIFDVYLGDMIVTWGQSWTKEQWSKFKEWYEEKENKLSRININIPRDISYWTRSWGRYFATYMAEKQLSYVYPYIARSTCFSDFGEHNKTVISLTFVQVPLMQGCIEKYSFGEIEELVHYDSFFERVLNKHNVISGISGEEICMDLNNMKTYAGKKRYIITNSKLKLEKIDSFGLTLKPICMNVIHQIQGNQLNMYKIKSLGEILRPWKGKKPRYISSYRRIKYEYCDASWRILIRYAPKEVYSRFKDLLKLLIEKVRRK